MNAVKPLANWQMDFSDPVLIAGPCSVESEEQVMETVGHQIDVLWIGARTSVNPFAVQEIADALNGIDIPVMIKNPINADLSLWLGAVERIRNAGIERVAVIHRGFSAYHHSKYRNLPRWEIPIAFKRAMPDVPLICDPSHICGRRDLLLEVSQKAIDLDFDGLMIESHINPEKALSDAKQQVTPVDYQKLIKDIVGRKL